MRAIQLTFAVAIFAATVVTSVVIVRGHRRVGEHAKREARSEQPMIAAVAMPQSRQQLLSMPLPSAKPTPPAPAESSEPRATIGENDSPGPTAEERAFTLKTDFESEVGRRDLREVERAIDLSLTATPIPGAKIAEVECRSTVCRLVAQFNDAASNNAFFKALFYPSKPVTGAEALRGMSSMTSGQEQQPDGSTKAIIYLRRE